MVLETTVLTALVIGLTEVVKRIGVNSKFLPLVAIVLGVGLSFGLKFLDVKTVNGAVETVNGLIAGLMSMGIWSGVKATLGK